MTEPTPTDAGAAPKMSAAEIEAEILRSRAELASQVDELMGRVDPRKAMADMPPAKLAAISAAVAAGLGLIVVRAVRRRRR